MFTNPIPNSFSYSVVKHHMGIKVHVVFDYLIHIRLIVHRIMSFKDTNDRGIQFCFIHCDKLQEAFVLPVYFGTENMPDLCYYTFHILFFLFQL